jgi:hypothetical protein
MAAAKKKGDDGLPLLAWTDALPVAADDPVRGREAEQALPGRAIISSF